MSEYGNGISMMQAFKMDNERIMKALEGKLLSGEDDNGFIYTDAPKEKCDEYIENTYQHAVYCCAEAVAWMRLYDDFIRAALELDDNGILKAFADEYGGVERYVAKLNNFMQELIYQFNSKEE